MEWNLLTSKRITFKFVFLSLSQLLNTVFMCFTFKCCYSTSRGCLLSLCEAKTVANGRVISEVKCVLYYITALERSTQTALDSLHEGHDESHGCIITVSNALQRLIIAAYSPSKLFIKKRMWSEYFMLCRSLQTASRASYRLIMMASFVPEKPVMTVWFFFFFQPMQPQHARRWSKTRSVPSGKWPKCSQFSGRFDEKP